MNEEEKKAIEYYQDKEISFGVDFDTEKLLKALGITEEDSFENHQIRFKTLLNLIEKLQKENEEWREAYQEEKDKQFEVIRKNQELEKRWNKDTHKLQNDLDIANAKIVGLLKENETLKETNKKLYETGLEIAKQRYTPENYIPVQKVKDKIEELRNNPLRINENNMYYYETDAYNKIIIRVLQELIEEREEK